MNTTKLWTPLSLLLLLGFIWGTGYSIARFAMTHDVPPLGYSFWQSLGPALLIGFFAWKKKSPSILTLEKKPFHYFFVCGLTGIAIPNTAMYFAAPHLPAGLLAVIVNTVPVMAYPLALFLRAESFHWMRITGILFAILGLLLITIPQTSLPSAASIPWVFVSLITPFCFAFCSVYIARYRPANSDSLSLAAGTLIASSAILIPIVIATKNFYSFHFPLTTQDNVILLEIILSSVGYLLFFQLLKIAGPVYYSLVDGIVALTGLFWGYIVFHEKLNEWTALAVLCILFALFLVTKRQQAMIESHA